MNIFLITHLYIMDLVFASNNKNKIVEIQSILDGSIKILSLEDIGCHEDIPETADTIEGNAILKADYVTKKYGYDCFADDTGLEISALNGEPEYIQPDMPENNATLMII